MNSNAFSLSSLNNRNKVNQIWREEQGSFVGKIWHLPLGHTAVTCLPSSEIVGDERKFSAEIRAGMWRLFPLATDERDLRLQALANALNSNHR